MGLGFRSFRVEGVLCKLWSANSHHGDNRSEHNTAGLSRGSMIVGVDLKAGARIGFDGRCYKSRKIRSFRGSTGFIQGSIPSKGFMISFLLLQGSKQLALQGFSL